MTSCDIVGAVDEVWSLSGNATKFEPQNWGVWMGEGGGSSNERAWEILEEWRTHEDANCSGAVCLNLEFGGQIYLSFRFGTWANNECLHRIVFCPRVVWRQLCPYLIEAIHCFAVIIRSLFRVKLWTVLGYPRVQVSSWCEREWLMTGGVNAKWNRGRALQMCGYDRPSGLCEDIWRNSPPARLPIYVWASH